MDDDIQTQQEARCLFEALDIVTDRLDDMESKLRVCKSEIKKTDRLRRWDDSERQRPPRKWPLNDEFLENNKPLLGLRDDRDYRNPDRRPHPPSAHDPWLGDVDAYAHERSWTDGPWGRNVTPNRGPTWGQWRVEPIDEHNWDIMLDKPTKPRYMLQPLEVCHLYFSASAQNTPTDTISQWLQEKLPGLPDAGLNARKIIQCFYPLTYDDWITRQMLNLTNDISCEHLHLRGPPLTVKRLVQKCDLFKVNCVTVHGKPIATHKIRSMLQEFHLDEVHFQLRYKLFNGYFPTWKWIASPQADKENLQQQDIYVLFSYSENNRSMIAHDTLAVELGAWCDETRRIALNHPTLPPISGTTRPLL